MKVVSEKSTLTVIFIASVSRSGSTMLDMVLGNHERCFSVGEMRQLQGFVLRSHAKSGVRDREQPLICTCGRYVNECDFWTAVEAESGLVFRNTPFKGQVTLLWKKLIQISYLVGSVRGVKILARLLSPVQRELAIGHNCFHVYEAIQALTGVDYIIDSSKDIYHYLLLRAARPRQVKLLMLYRDGRAVAYSQIRGRRASLWPQKATSPFVQAVRQWVKVNRNIRLFSARTSAAEKLTVRYEEICQRPQEVLKLIYSRFGIEVADFGPQVDKSNHHNIGGSPSRFALSLSAIRLDERWRTALTSQELENFERIGGRLNRKLGYR